MGTTQGVPNFSLLSTQVVPPPQYLSLRYTPTSSTTTTTTTTTMEDYSSGPLQPNWSPTPYSQSGITTPSNSNPLLTAEPHSDSGDWIQPATWLSPLSAEETLDDSFAALSLDNGHCRYLHDVGPSNYKHLVSSPSGTVGGGGGGGGGVSNVGKFSLLQEDGPLFSTTRPSFTSQQESSNFDGSRVVGPPHRQLNGSVMTGVWGSGDHGNISARFLSDGAGSSPSSTNYYNNNFLQRPNPAGYGRTACNLNFDEGGSSGADSGMATVGHYVSSDLPASFYDFAIAQQQLIFQQQHQQILLQQRQQQRLRNAPGSVHKNGYPIGPLNDVNFNFGRGVNPRRHQRHQHPACSFDMGDLRGDVASWAMDQNKCRLLQAKLEDHPRMEDFEQVLSELIGKVPELMRHPFGNYLVQRLIEICNEDQRTRVLFSVIANKLQLLLTCQNTHGTRAIQKLLEHLTNEKQISQFMTAIAPLAVVLAKDMNGQHVIQQCLKLFLPRQNMPLLKKIAEKCFEVATDKSGCCVLQQCVEYSDGQARMYLLSEIIVNSLPLSENQYGNYVVQFLLGLKNRKITGEIIKCLKGSYVSLSCNKFASNVVEKCLRESDIDDSSKIIVELIRCPNGSMLLLDPYGNYVIQAALQVSEGGIHNALLSMIEEHKPSMRSNMYGKKVLAWIERRGSALILQ